MSYLRGYGIFLALALTTAMHQLPPVESFVLVAGKVRVSNQFPSPMVIHCSSDDHTVDLGTQTVGGGSSFEWNVSIVVGRSNIYNCPKAGDFVLFDPKKDVSSEVCGLKNFVCDWQLRNGGWFLYYAKRREDMRQLPKWVKPRGPYRALTFQEKEYYRKRAEESRDGFDVPDIPDDIDPCEIDVKPFKLDQHPPGSELWKELADYSKLALDKYNKCNSAAKYQFAKLIKANYGGGYPFEYFITFQAYDMACFRCKTFQASVTTGFKETTADCWPEPYPTSPRSRHNIDAGAVECSSADQHRMNLL